MPRVRVLVVVLAALVGCGDRTPRAPRVDDPGAQLKLAKLTPFIDCLERHTAPVGQLADLVQRGGTTVEPTPDPQKCQDDLSRARAIFLWPELDVAGGTFVAALVRVHELSDVAATNRAIPEGLRQQLAMLDAAQSALFDLVRQLNRAVHEEMLVAREQKDGGTLGVLIERIVFQAEALVERAAVAWDRLDGLDVGALSQAVADLETRAQAMTSRALAEPKEVTAWDGYYNFQHHLRALLVSTNALVQRARDKVPYTDAEKIQISAGGEANVVGTPGAVIAAYNRVVEMYGVR